MTGHFTESPLSVCLYLTLLVGHAPVDAGLPTPLIRIPLESPICVWLCILDTSSSPQNTEGSLHISLMHALQRHPFLHSRAPPCPAVYSTSSGRACGRRCHFSKTDKWWFNEFSLPHMDSFSAEEAVSLKGNAARTKPRDTV